MKTEQPTTPQEAVTMMVEWLNARTAHAGDAARQFLCRDPEYGRMLLDCDKGVDAGDLEATKGSCRELMKWVETRTVPSFEAKQIAREVGQQRALFKGDGDG